MEFDDDYQRAYLKLQEDLKLTSPSNTIRLSKESFKSNTFLLSLDTTGCRCSSVHNHENSEKRGKLTADLTFSSALSENIQMFVYAIFHRNVKISKYDREVEVEI